MSRVLVTGATGFVGRRTLTPLLAAGHDVHAVARAPVEGPEPVRWHAADILATSEVVAEVRPEVLLHLAWYAEHGKFWTSSENVRWVEASLSLLRAFADADGRRAVIAGTCAEYDWTVARDVLLEDSSPLRPATLYGAAKHGLHEVARAHADQVGFDLVWGRVFSVYGPDEAPGRLFASVARALLAGERVGTTSGTQVRDFLHADDVAGAFAALAGSPVSGAVNIASGEPLQVRDFVRRIADAVGRPELLDVGTLPQRPGEPERLVADVGRLHDEVGFAPARGLSDGITAAVESMKLLAEIS
ncbi:MAG: NAD(P)-dependent oxidoreductase [Actinomycetota bacterium]|nr:NAD(P)-dependent oxidoreductase [Actinomycetota bacterium]